MSGSARTPAGHGQAWAALVANHDQLKKWLVEQELTAVKAGELLARQGVVVPQRTLHRYALEVLGVGRSARGVTVRVADGEPLFAGSEPVVHADVVDNAGVECLSGA